MTVLRPPTLETGDTSSPSKSYLIRYPGSLTSARPVSTKQIISTLATNIYSISILTHPWNRPLFTASVNHFTLLLINLSFWLCALSTSRLVGLIFGQRASLWCLTRDEAEFWRLRGEGTMISGQENWQHADLAETEKWKHIFVLAA